MAVLEDDNHHDGGSEAAPLARSQPRTPNACLIATRLTTRPRARRSRTREKACDASRRSADIGLVERSRVGGGERGALQITDATDLNSAARDGSARPPHGRAEAGLDRMATKTWQS